ncbi:MAG TPA: class I SAM-dependent methyltransferase [Thermoplasmata archaeon]|nr:class I SAM-dependent methyltransferase [Thermoplasmata archaeon]
MGEPHWTNDLFLEHADIFLRIHEAHLESAEAEARDIAAILERGGVRPPARVLDAPCGIGRHDVHLERLGYHVTGVDFAPAFLERARRLAAEFGVAPELVQGDLRVVAQQFRGREGSFSAILNLWTSIGYWDEEADHDILRQFHVLAAEGGLLIVDTVNRDWLVRAFRPQGYDEWGDLVLVEERTFDLRTSWILGPWRFYTRRGDDLVHRATMSVDHRMYAGHELKRLVESAGWRTVGLYGGLGMEELSPANTRIVLVARKEE